MRLEESGLAVSVPQTPSFVQWVILGYYGVLRGK